MILQLGSSTEFIRVTAEYSNAVLLAILPYVSDFAQKAELPVPHPTKVEHVVGCGVLPWRNTDGGIAGAGIRISGGWTLRFQSGYVNSFTSPNSYFGLQNPDEIPRYFGTVRMNPEQAVALARESIRKLGIPLEQLFAEQEPGISPLEKVGTNTIPRYKVQWVDPVGSQTAEAEVNADAKRVESLSINSTHLHKPSPKVSVVPPRRSGFGQPQARTINPEYAKKLIPVVLRAVDAYGAVLALDVPRPLTTNYVARFELHDNGGWPACELELTNGWRFVYRNNMVNGYYTPNNLFNNDSRPKLMKDLAGQWRMSEAQAIELVKRALAKFNYPTNLVHVDFPPKLTKPSLPGIPRYSIHWWKENADASDLVSKVEAEVDADKGELTSLYYDHTAYWNKPPPIDVPLSLPQQATNAEESRTGRPLQVMPNRPFKPFTTNNALSRKR